MGRLFVLKLVLTLSFTDCRETINVKTKIGELQGTVETTILTGRSFYAFKGIPYAKTPKRFELAEPPEPWNDVFNATENGESCPQTVPFEGPKVIGSDDCLFLNVYTPKLNRRSCFLHRRHRLPVMVHIHGGSFYSGSASSDLYGPKRFLEKDVVYVAMNYRLGPLGYLSTGDDEIRGNFGLQDQALALKWVQNNIQAFGGDKERVTIFGYSAGSVSVGHHLLSPMSKGLFRNAIMSSGVPLNHFATVADPLAVSRTLAAQLNCAPANTTKEMADCFRSTSNSELIRADYKLRNGLFYPIFFGPTTERHSMDRKFLPDTIMNLIEGKRFNSENVIVGTTESEGSLVYKVLEQAIYKFPTFDAFIDHVLPDFLAANTGFSLGYMPTVVNKSAHHYHIRNLSRADKDQFEDGLSSLVTDVAFQNGTQWFVRELADRGVTVRQFIFDFNETIPHLKYLANISTKGVSHGDDVLYQFDMSYHSAKFEGKQAKVSQNFIDLWTNFATYDDPVHGGLANWSAVTESKPSFLRIRDELVEENGVFKANDLKFWTTLSLSQVAASRGF